MNKKITVLTALALVAAIAIVVQAQSDATSRSVYTKKLQDQSSHAGYATHREGLHVATYTYDISGALTAGTAFEFSQSDLPDNAIIAPGGYVDITTAMVPVGAYTGTITYAASTALSTTNWGVGGVIALSTLNGTKLTADSEMNITFTGTAPASALTFTVYQPYILGN